MAKSKEKKTKAAKFSKKKIEKKKAKKPKTNFATKKKLAKPKENKKSARDIKEIKKGIKKIDKPTKAPSEISASKPPSPRAMAGQRPPSQSNASASQSIFSGVHQTRIRVIGIGGGGGTIVSEIAARVKKSDFYGADTNTKSLKGLSKLVKSFQFGLETTKGFGTGMNPEVGRLAAEESAEKIQKILEGQDLTIIVACLGGGTSSGAAATFARISKSLGNITYGIFTMPFEFEGEKKTKAALEALAQIRPNLDVFTIIPNEGIFKIVDKNTPLKDALSAINKKLAGNLEGLIEAVYFPGLINIDFADLRAILTGKGRLAYLNTIELEGASREEITQKLISSPIYPYTIKGAKGVLYNITSSRGVQLSEVSQISNIILETANKSAKIIFGVNQHSRYNEKPKIMLLATGCAAKEFLNIAEGSDTNGPVPEKKIKNPKPAKVMKKAKSKKEKKAISEKSEKKKKKANKILPKATEDKPKKAKIGKPVQKADQAPVKAAVMPEPVKEKELEIEEEAVEVSPKISVIANVAEEEEKFDAPKVQDEKAKLIESKPDEDNIIKDDNDEPNLHVNVVLPKIATISQPAPVFAKTPERSPEFSKVRRNGLQVKKEMEQAEKEFLEQETMWDVPAILRKKKIEDEDL